MHGAHWTLLGSSNLLGNQEELLLLFGYKSTQPDKPSKRWDRIYRDLG